MQDIAALLDAHQCASGCSRFAHAQSVLVSPGDVDTVAHELILLAEVRDRLAERGHRMLEGLPTPRFDPEETDAKPWDFRYERIGVVRRRSLRDLWRES